MGTMISAMTGSEDPQEVAQMAKQASEVIYRRFSIQACIVLTLGSPAVMSKKAIDER